MTTMDSKFILERHLFWGTHDTIEYLKTFYPDIGKKTLRRIIELCWNCVGVNK